jgi:hypothetical protein
LARQTVVVVVAVMTALHQRNSRLPRHMGGPEYGKAPSRSRPIVTPKFIGQIEKINNPHGHMTAGALSFHSLSWWGRHVGIFQQQLA